jgi:hypothetical protein
VVPQSFDSLRSLRIVAPIMSNRSLFHS